MQAVMALREPLVTEKEIGRVGSAYMTVRSIVYDLIEGTYWEGYTSGEDQAGREVDNPRKAPE